MPEPQRHWSVDFVEHLRTVHFALIAVSIALLTLALSPSAREVSKALDQLRAINEVRREWKNDFLEAAAATKIHELPSSDRSQAEVFQLTRGRIEAHWPKTEEGKPELIFGYQSATPDTISIVGWHGKTISRKVSFERPNWAIMGPIRDFPAKRGDDRRLLLPEPKNLQEFKDIWNRLNSPNLIEIPLDVDLSAHLEAALVDNSSEQATVPFYFGQPQRLPPPKEIEAFELRTCKTNSHQMQLCYENKNYLIDERVGLPVVETTKISLDGQSILRKQFAQYTAFHGTFGESFRELEQFTNQFQALPFETIVCSCLLARIVCSWF